MTKKKKNVLLITVDQWAANMLGCAGHPDIRTPSIDMLASCGVRYTSAYSCTPVCIPARRELMTGTSARTHGDRTFNERLVMPNLPTLAQTFRDAGYQAYGVGKLHVYPQRSRIGFDDVLLNEESRRVNFPDEMREDDYTRFISRKGYVGLSDAHGMSNNDYLVRPWHLEEQLHQTSWTAQNMCEYIIRRDPSRPAFWYCGFAAPHPPLVPPHVFWEMYRDVQVRLPDWGAWAKDFDALPYALKYYRSIYGHLVDKQKVEEALRGYYALCTHIDFSIRSIIGTLREEKVLDDTIIAFVADHGELLGSHGLWGKNLFYEQSTKIPFILIPTTDCDRLAAGTTDDRLVQLCDVMPTLLDLAGIMIPNTVEGMSLLDSSASREYVYGELWEDDRATRMICTNRYKLIYYALGNRVQLFDREHDPHELSDMAADPAYEEVLADLKQKLIGRLYGSDLAWMHDGELVGLANKPFRLLPAQQNMGILNNRDLLLQRGIK